MRYGLDYVLDSEELSTAMCKGCTCREIENDTGFITCPYDWDFYHPACPRNFSITQIQKILLNTEAYIDLWVHY